MGREEVEVIGDWMSTVTPWMNINGAAAYLAVSRVTLRKLIREGHLTAHRIPGTRDVRLHAEDLDKALGRNNTYENRNNNSSVGVRKADGV